MLIKRRPTWQDDSAIAWRALITDTDQRIVNRMNYNKGKRVVSIVEITPEGWVLAEFTMIGIGRTYHLYLIEADSLVEVYTLDQREFYGFASMPPNWAIPF